MGIKTILAGASGGSASGGALELGCRLAARFGAHLEAMHVRLDVGEVVMAAGAEGLAAAADLGWAEQTSGEVEAIAEATRVQFAAAAARHGLKLAKEPGGAAWHEETGDAAALVARRARFFDLVVLGRSDRVIDAPHTDAIEETLIRSGRPVLLAPAEAPGAIGESMAIAWNGSAEAVRAVAGALPLLRLAKKTVVITLGEEEGEGAEALRAYLGLHGIAATQRSVPAVAGERPGGQLLSAARDEGADLLVLGGYSHPPWREMLFGGATSEIVGRSLLPVLVAH
ncbi:MAG TPA: universal stress protein [Acetobacteraceae bacterium]|jgi:nucleotide-binding universal stress UspA family protein|nr:universal stress protein [Acetobacteraceae bacterium]